MARSCFVPALPAPGLSACPQFGPATRLRSTTASCDTPDLLGRCLDRGAEEDWRAFLPHYEPRIRGVIRRALDGSGVRMSCEDLEDLVQECNYRLLSLARRLDRGTGGWFRGRSEGEAWSYLACVARAVAIDFLRARKAAKRPRPEVGCSSYRLLSSLPAVQSTPEERMLICERLAELVNRWHRHWGSRSDCLRTHAVKRAVIDGWTSAEIARESRGALTRQQVDGLVYRVRRRLAAEGVRLARRGAATGAA